MHIVLRYISVWYSSNEAGLLETGELAIAVNLIQVSRYDEETRPTFSYISF